MSDLDKSAVSKTANEGGQDNENGRFGDVGTDKRYDQKSRVLLLSIKDYRGEYHLVNDITFSAAMLDLTEQPGVGSIVNQVTQLTRIYNFSLHLPLWLKLIKCNEFLALTGV